MLSKVALINALISAVSAGTIIWDGRFNDMTSSSDLEKWSFSNPVGDYQYYIHGSGAVSDYVNLDSKFKNPADTGSKQGVKITIDETAKWNGQSMLRTELIPQTTAAINKGKVYYHFSVKTTSTNKPTENNEHQVAFFESHFTEMKYGAAGGSSNKLQWHVGGVSKWDAELVADEWHNVAYEIDFDAGSVSFYHSTGSDALTKTAGPFDASTQSNGADWHLGVLRLPGSNDAAGAEDCGDLTTSVNSAGGAASGDSAPVSSAAAAPASSKATVASSAAATSAAATSAATTSAAAAETPVASSAAPVSSAVKSPASSSSAAAVETPVTSFTAAAPSSTAGAGASDELPTEFTLKELIAWVKAKNGEN
ncbi:hypothetical protein E8E12_005146 [Didymella heteroderae]|uniref:Glycoside hydrolase 131 catalytic N-terminal domain-containing protein n=1 Tax=Didymella heteroderae TaxID=1769908 RepID=A0A9P4WJG9_9PLEO|nr:hypothetical protein E8E12_005146 [Didymella heteroderae]